MLIKIVTKSRINLYTLNCLTGPYQPKCKIMFNKNSPKRTLLEGLCKFKAKDMRRRRRKRRIGTDSSLDLTPSTKLYIPSNIKNMCFCCLWADWAVRAVMKISTLLLKYLYLWGRFFHTFRDIFFLFYFLYIVGSPLKSWLTQKWKITVGLFQTHGILGIYNFAHTLK